MPASPRPIIQWIGFCTLLYGIIEVIGFIAPLSSSLAVASAFSRGTWSIHTIIRLGIQVLYGIGAIGLVWGGFACLARHPYTTVLLWIGGLSYAALDLIGTGYALAATRRVTDEGTYLVNRISQSIIAFVVPFVVLAFIWHRAGSALLRFRGSLAPDSSEDHGQELPLSATLAYARPLVPHGPQFIAAAARHLSHVLPWAALALGFPTVLRLLVQTAIQHKAIPWARFELFHGSLFFWGHAMRDWSGLILIFAGILLLRNRPAGIAAVLVAVALALTAEIISQYEWYLFLSGRGRSPLYYLSSFFVQAIPSLLGYVLLVGLLTAAPVRQQIYLDAPTPVGVEDPRTSA